MLNFFRHKHHKIKSHSETIDNELIDMGLFIVIPDDIIRPIEKEFPDINDIVTHDSSPRHITLLIMNNEYDKIDKIKEITDDVLSRYEPFMLYVSGTNTFINEKDNTKVLYANVYSDELIDMHWRLRYALEDNDIKINHYYGGEKQQIYKPHMTLAFYDDINSEEDDIELKASWLIDRVELWGHHSPILFKIGDLLYH